MLDFLLYHAEVAFTTSLLSRSVISSFAEHRHQFLAVQRAIKLSACVANVHTFLTCGFPDDITYLYGFGQERSVATVHLQHAQIVTLSPPSTFLSRHSLLVFRATQAIIRTNDISTWNMLPSRIRRGRE